MTSYKRKAVFIDIDGTLILRGGAPFREDLQAMEEAAGKGHLLFLNSGRSFGNIPQSLLGFSFIKGIAAGGGAHILLAGTANQSRESARYETIYRKWIPEEILERIISWYQKQSLYCVLEGERNCYILNDAEQLQTAKAPIPIYSFDDFKNKCCGDLVTKVTLDGFASHEESLLLEPFFTVNPFTDYTEAIIKGENKGKAMGIILDAVGIERKDSIAIGDSANDLDMIRFAGLGVAMGNASAVLKAEAGAVTADCGKGGVAEVLRKHVLL